MKYVAAYLLAAQFGAAPSKDAVTKILESIGADIEADKLDKVFSELDGKNVEEVIAEGMRKVDNWKLARKWTSQKGVGKSTIF